MLSAFYTVPIQGQILQLIADRRDLFGVSSITCAQSEACE